MKGLLLKDFYMARKYCRAYVVIAVVFSLLAVWGNTSFLLAYPVLLASVIPVNLISYDEKSKWSSFSGVFPYSKQQLVSVKYLMALIFLAFAIILVLVGQITRMLINSDDEWSRFCDSIAKGSVWLTEEGFYSFSGYGDGCYGVYAQKSDNEIVALEIRFI